VHLVQRFLIVLLVIASVSYAKTPYEKLPPIVAQGIKAYEKGGPTEAIKQWIKGGPLEGSRDALAQANMFRQIEDLYGKYMDFEVIDIYSLSASCQLVYIILKYEKGPLFMSINLYNSTTGWVMPQFNVNTKPENVLPATLLYSR